MAHALRVDGSLPAETNSELNVIAPPSSRLPAIRNPVRRANQRRRRRDQNSAAEAAPQCNGRYGTPRAVVRESCWQSFVRVAFRVRWFQLKSHLFSSTSFPTESTRGVLFNTQASTLIPTCLMRTLVFKWLLKMPFAVCRSMPSLQCVRCLSDATALLLTRCGPEPPSTMNASTPGLNTFGGGSAIEAKQAREESTHRGDKPESSPGQSWRKLRARLEVFACTRRILPCPFLWSASLLSALQFQS